ncbi:hypothetical protein DSL92_07695 [Billgrantia gudaonensis]|uniref:Uncharacterized protein n=1 Tax=Billgrantia gudaonensis TaxID=376427 RepID=A0A3S0NDP5_9GAMM|nr:hypothetical protein DSL92_07695 [Halomonas gudaonensis]
MRDLSRHHGSTGIAPVVFTAGLDVSWRRALFSQRVTATSANWRGSCRRSHGALDAQVASAYGGVLIAGTFLTALEALG